MIIMTMVRRRVHLSCPWVTAPPRPRLTCPAPISTAEQCAHRDLKPQRAVGQPSSRFHLSSVPDPRVPSPSPPAPLPFATRKGKHREGPASASARPRHWPIGGQPATWRRAAPAVPWPGRAGMSACGRAHVRSRTRLAPRWPFGFATTRRHVVATDTFVLWVDVGDRLGCLCTAARYYNGLDGWPVTPPLLPQ